MVSHQTFILTDDQVLAKRLKKIFLPPLALFHLLCVRIATPWWRGGSGQTLCLFTSLRSTNAAHHGGDAKIKNTGGLLIRK